MNVATKGSVPANTKPTEETNRFSGSWQIMALTRKFLGLLALILMCTSSYGQKSGEFQLGIRSTTSLFSHDAEFGTGVGGQFRIGFFDRMNSEWFADYITSDINGLAKRTDGHIGWSVMFYPLTPKKRFVQPYLLMGHCFDYTRVEIFSSGEMSERWSSAFQTGLGTHFNLSDRTDLSLNAQYMGHIGKDLHVEVADDGHTTHSHEEELMITSDPHSKSLEGHLLITVSFNVKIGQLWTRKEG